MSEYVSRVGLTINGQEITDFKSVELKEVTLRKPVNLVRKTGHFNITPRYGATVEYVIPKDAPEFDFESVEGGTLTIDYENGKRTTLTGVSTLSVGAAKFDGDNEATKSIDLLAADGKIEQ